MSVVSNTGPLIALAKVDALALLKSLFGEVKIAPAVYLELFAKTGPEIPRLHAAFQDFLTTVPLPPMDTSLEAATQHLGAGEQQAVLLAHSENTLLLIDDRQGRSAARSLNLSVSGTVGVLIEAKQNNLIPQILPLLEQIRQNGYWLSDALLMTAANLTGETFTP